MVGEHQGRVVRVRVMAEGKKEYRGLRGNTRAEWDEEESKEQVETDNRKVFISAYVLSSSLGNAQAVSIQYFLAFLIFACLSRWYFVLERENVYLDEMKKEEREERKSG